MLDPETHEAIVQAIVDFPKQLAGDIPAIIEDLKTKFPAATEGEIIGCFPEGLERLQAKVEEHTRQSEALRNLAPLFDGMPDGMTLGECAAIKAEQGDPLALSYLAWEAEQAGGIQ